MGSQLHELDFGSLAILDNGKINAVFRKHLKRASDDCQDRTGDAKPRQVIMEVTFFPVTEQDGDCSEVKWDVKIKSKVPPHQSKAYSAGMRRNGTFIFAEDSLDNVNQNTLDYGDDE